VSSTRISSITADKTGLSNWQWCALYAIVMGLWIFLASLLIDDQTDREQWQALSMIWPLVLAALAVTVAILLAIAPFYGLAHLGNKGRILTATPLPKAPDHGETNG